jgi:hypothetical protein
MSLITRTRLAKLGVKEGIDGIGAKRGGRNDFKRTKVMPVIPSGDCHLDRSGDISNYSL